MRKKQIEYDYRVKYNAPKPEINNQVFEIFAKEVEFFRKIEHERHKFAIKYGNQARALFN